MVRSTELVDGSATKYELFDKPQDPLFGGDRQVTRANVAKSMTDMILTEKLWEEWKYKYPTVYDMN